MDIERVKRFPVMTICQQAGVLGHEDVAAFLCALQELESQQATVVQAVVAVGMTASGQAGRSDDLPRFRPGPKKDK